MRLIAPLFIVGLAAFGSSTVARKVAFDAPPTRPRPTGKDDGTRTSARERGEHVLLATLVDTHSPTRLALDDSGPDEGALASLLRDPVVGSQHRIDEAILPLIRAVVARYPASGVDGSPEVRVVSGFRSPKLNEALRKKGHEVASHSQHSQGHAMDFRIVRGGNATPADPRELALLVRDLEWKGGVGIYLGKNDRFVHADTGPLRTWYGH
jgi:uncharacterized protein YcbK (DUF882 family)